ncbi:hypothetical protein G4B88_008240 [Cannabis sativa]|uniref:Disease resistance N-terminal domain-containing protein n=1 Tax=Cannabis sativa TaxID=3483 RepID=A0A7J6FLL9_CANSA|nr:hypothetical protein G4B88_008240 [Cannabis sativa]
MRIHRLENSDILYKATNPTNPSSSSTGCFPSTLQELRLLSCGSSFRSLNMDLFPNLKTLEIAFSHHIEVVSMSDGKSLEELTSLTIRGCNNFASFPDGGLIAPKLSEFIVRDCSKLKWLPKKMTSLLSLESLAIVDCPLMETFPKGEGGLPVSLSTLEISCDGKNETSSVVSERLFKLKSTFNSLAAIRFEVENKRIKNPAVEKWLDDPLDVVDDAEDFFGDIEYDAMKPNKVDESKKEKQKAISKLLTCFSKPMAELVIEAFLSASFDFLLEKITSPYVEDFFFKGKNESSSVVSERLFKLKSTFNCLAAVCIEVENKRIKNPAVEKWLDNLLDAVDDAEDFFGDIEYDAMKPKNVELKKEKRKAISKLLSCCSKPSNSADCERNAKMEAILKRLEHLADQIGKLNLEKNVGEVKPSESSRAKTSLPDEPELYVDLARTISGKYSCLLEQTDNIDRLEKKTRHLGCVKELYADNKIASYDFGATRLRTFLTLLGSSSSEIIFSNEIECNDYFEAISVSDGKSLEELTFLLIENCGSFVSFPNGGLIAPKLSDLQIFNCPKLKWLPEKMTSLSSLKSLTIIGCPLIETSPENGMPASLNGNMEEILKRLEYLANQIGNLNLEKNVVEVKPSESSRVKTSLPDEPELYVSMSFFVKSWDRRGSSCFVIHDLLVDLAKIVAGKYSSLLEHNEDIVTFEKKTRHLGCVMEHSSDNKYSHSTIPLPSSSIPLLKKLWIILQISRYGFISQSQNSLYCIQPLF